MFRRRQEAVLRALRETTLPRLTLPDQPLLAGLLADLFPGLPAADAGAAALEAKLAEVCAEARLKLTDGFRRRAAALSETLHARHSVVLLGAAGMGKTQTWRALAKVPAHPPADRRGTHIHRRERRKNAGGDGRTMREQGR